MTSIIALRSLPDRELVHQLLDNESDGSLIRKVIRERMSARQVGNLYDFCTGVGARQNGAVLRTQPERGLARSEAIARVRAIQSQPNLDQVIDILLSDWDFKDPRGRLRKSPEETIDFLEMIQSGRQQTWDDLHPEIRGLLGVICDAWLASH